MFQFEDTRRKRIIYDTNDKGCHLVTNLYQDRDGHVQVSVNGKTSKLHRTVYESVHGTIPEGAIVRHMCDNPNCVNIQHLELGTHEDNVKDRVQRGRSATLESHGRAKLTIEKVKEIRKSSLTVTELSKKYGVSRKAIRLILDNKTWVGV